jgi:DNA-binding LytR/AlgR family response regulator
MFIGTEHEDEILIYTKQRTELVDKIEALCSEENTELVGYLDRDGVKLDVSDIHCFVVEDNRVFALTDDNKYRMKQRLYSIEETLDNRFVKINKSSNENIRQIRKFSASVSGTMNVTLKNGYSDYVSRRNIKNVKERLGK